MLTKTGTKRVGSKFGVVHGFGATYGTGSTDRIAGLNLPNPKSGVRSVVFHYYALSTGGGTTCRIIAASPFGLVIYRVAGRGFQYVDTLPTLDTIQFGPTSDGLTCPTNQWTSYGFTAFPNAVPNIAYLNGKLEVTRDASTTNSGDVFGSGISNYYIGNDSASSKNVDGYIGPILLFDGRLTDAEHLALHLNPAQVAAPDFMLSYPLGGVSVALGTLATPSGDLSNTGWTQSTGPTLWQMLDETTASDTDYISCTTTGSVCTLSLNLTAYPGGATQTHTIRGQSSTGGGVSVQLINTANSAVVRTMAHTFTPSWADYTVTLTSGEIAAITSGSLKVQLTSF